MIIGIDFDNTIVAYDALFHRVALEKGLIPAALPVNKVAVRDHLRSIGQEDAWTEMQGTVYGARIAEAEIFPGLREFLIACRQRGISVRIVSHKTQFPYLGERHDLHAAARGWLHQHGLIDPATTGINDSHVFFELTKADKLARIAACGCAHFIDDLPELLTDPAFPPDVARFLFDPQNTHTAIPSLPKVASWPALQSLVLATAAPQPGVERLAVLCGLNAPLKSLLPLQGGANNRVYRLVLEGGNTVLAKHYFQHPGDPRDRFQSERAFYRYLEAGKISQTPVALGWDENGRMGLFSFIEGNRSAATTSEHVKAALDFVFDLNTQRQFPEALALPAASEACFSLDSHLASVQCRVDRILSLPQEDQLDELAGQFVHHDLIPAWTAVSASLANDYDAAGRARILTQEERCISPSDFGFHNSLTQPDGRIVFFDFEYAGWDDPAKLVADFFCQPDVPVSLNHFDSFVSAVAAALQLVDVEAFAFRCRALLPVYQIKWACILLNDFSPLGRDRRVFALGAEAATARRDRQLIRARTLLGGLLQAA